MAAAKSFEGYSDEDLDGKLDAKLSISEFGDGSFLVMIANVKAGGFKSMTYVLEPDDGRRLKEFLK